MKKVTAFMLFRVVFSATLWFCAGNAVGWYIGSKGGFHRGIILMTDFVLTLKDANSTVAQQPPKYRDL